MRVEEIMTTDVVTTTAETSVREATQLVLQHRVAALPVLDADGQLVGIVSELDLLRRRVQPDPRAHLLRVTPETDDAPQSVGEVMTTQVQAVPAGTDAAQVAELLASTGVKSVPVVRGSHVIGVIGRRDLLRHLDRDDAAIAADVGRALGEQASYLGRWDVEVTDGQVELTGGALDRVDPARSVASTVDGVVRVRATVLPSRDGGDDNRGP